MQQHRKSGSKKRDTPKQTTLQVSEPIEIMNFLQLRFPDKSRTTIKSILTHRQVSVDHKIVTSHDHSLLPGQLVVINWGKVPEEIYYPGLKILFEDEYLIVIDKEAGLLSISTNKETEKTAYSILSDHVKRDGHRNKIFVVHRLDRETSGVMLFAKSKEVQQKLQERWSETIMERTYIAVTEGLFDKDEGTITNFLYESKALKMYSGSDPKIGQKAVTHYRVIMKNENYSMLEVNLETGRKNQIRVHMQDLGHSIIGDKKYGSIQNPIKRIGLHARIISFIHPGNGEALRFETEIPPKFLKLFAK
jgi:23S rRNA pseudouridine1911/1915/1917 synthase